MQTGEGMNNSKISAEEYLEMRDGLDAFLDRYICAKGRRDALEERLKQLQADINDPRHSARIDGMPHGSGGNNDGAGSAPIQKTVVEEQITRQSEEMARVEVEIMSVLDYLNPLSFERSVLELRYLDGVPMEEMQNKIPYCRSSAYTIWRRGLDTLLEEPKVWDRVKLYNTTWKRKHPDP